MTTYFAYGTLLDEDLMRTVAPSARALCLAKLEDHRMAFAVCAGDSKSGCTLSKTPGFTTYGIVYSLSPEDRAKMDRSTICDDRWWVDYPVELKDDAGNTITSSTYIIPGDPVPRAPTDEYVKPILKGLNSLPVPPDYLVDMHKIIEKAQKRIAD